MATACASDAGEAPPEPVGDSAPVSAEEFDYDAHLVALREATQVEDPPSTEIVRVIAPDEQPEVWQACMQEAGYEVSVTSDGGLTPPQDLPDDQWGAYDLANYICHAQYPVDQSLVPQFGTEQVDVLYGYYVEELVPCLQERGFEVDEPPTIETFRASWVSGDEGLHASESTWFPYTAVDAAEISMDEWEAVNAACPQSPSHEVLFGSED